MGVVVEPVTKVCVSGKSPELISGEIIEKLGDAPSLGCVITLQGLSGTGKGTTVAKLQELVPNVQVWSNGNIFRSITYLAVCHAGLHNMEIQEVLQAQLLDDFFKKLTFDKFGDKFDVKIEAAGSTMMVSEVQATVLKDDEIARNIPTVAEATQGEVINFVQGALQKMAAAGLNVLLEGREQTLNHIRTPHRFELVFDDNSIIGKRQAALRVAGRAYEKLKDNPAASADEVSEKMTEALMELVADVNHGAFPLPTCLTSGRECCHQM